MEPLGLRGSAVFLKDQKVAYVIAMPRCLRVARSAAGNEVVNPRKYGAANQAIDKPPDQTKDAPQRTNVVTTVDLSDPRNLSRSTLKKHDPPRYTEEPKPP